MNRQLDATQQCLMVELYFGHRCYCCPLLMG